MAITALALGTGSLRERLINACMCNIIVRETELPRGLGPKMSDGLVRRLAGFGDTVTSRPASGDEGTIVSTISAMSDDDVRYTAEELVGLASAVEWEFLEAVEAAARGTRDGETPPPEWYLKLFPSGG